MQNNPEKYPSNPAKRNFWRGGWLDKLKIMRRPGDGRTNSDEKNIDESVAAFREELDSIDTVFGYQTPELPGNEFAVTVERLRYGEYKVPQVDDKPLGLDLPENKLDQQPSAPVMYVLHIVREGSESVYVSVNNELASVLDIEPAAAYTIFEARNEVIRLHSSAQNPVMIGQSEKGAARLYSVYNTACSANEVPDDSDFDDDAVVPPGVSVLSEVLANLKNIKNSQKQS